MNHDPALDTLKAQWNGVHVHAHVSLLRRTNRSVDLGEIIMTTGFRDIDEWRGYGEAGSFVLFLVERYGIGALREFVRTSSGDESRGVIEARIRTVWGTTLADAQAEWLTLVDAWPN